MAPADPRVLERVGSVLHEKWTLERLIGVGGMGAVYAARHRNGARAAVKVLSLQAGSVPHIRKRFLHEGYAANRVDHPGAVKVLDDDVIAEGPDEGTAYLVMELLDGESLQERAKRDPPLTPRELLELADGVLSVLSAAHSNGVVHRDLKPDNLFLPSEGAQIKVLDFGLARLLETQEQTIAGMAIGTATYMSPEQAAGHVDEIDGRTDIYALGSILFQLVSNKRIHDAAHTLGLVVRMATTPAPKLRSVAPDVSGAFADVVDRALAFKREDRYPTASAMRVAVREALDHLDNPDSPVSLARPAPLDAAHDVGTAKTVAAAPAAILAATGAGKSTPPSGASVSLPRAGSWTRPVTFLALAAIASFVAWRNWDAIGRVLASPPAAPPTTASAPPSPQTVADASPPESPSVADASALPIADAASDEDADVGRLDSGLLDGSALVTDGGEEDDEDDEDDVDAGAPPSSSVSPPPRRSGHPAAKPPRKPRPPRRPGQPRKKKRWRW